MATAITFDGNNLQTSSVTTESIDHYSLANKNANSYALAHANKSVLPFVNYPSRQIIIKGSIKGTSIADADAKVDAFKAYFNKKDANLDIGYNGGTRRYIATAQGIDIPPDQGLTVRDFTVVFICTNPFGQNTSSSSLVNSTGNTAATANFAPTFLGTAPWQLPVITLTFNSATTGSPNVVTNPDFETNTTGYSTGGIGTFTRVTSQFHGGAASGQMVNASSSPLSVPQTNSYAFWIYPLSGLTVGATYTVSVWVKGNAGGENFGISTLSSPTTIRSLTTSWQQVTFTFTAGFTTDQLYFSSTTASATWFMDDVSVTMNVPAYVSVVNHANGQGIVIFSSVISPGDVIVMDSNTRKVTQNGTEIDYIGAFIEIAAGLAQFDYSDGLTTRNYDINISQNPLFA